jgi:hypothetical protein
VLKPNDQVIGVSHDRPISTPPRNARRWSTRTQDQANPTLLAAMPNLIGCESSRSQDYQFEKQVKRAQECRELQDKLVGDQPLTPERADEITKTMDRTGCTARLPAH